MKNAERKNSMTSPLTPLRLLVGALVVLSCVETGVLAAQQTIQESEPLPLEVAVALRNHINRSPINLSPDGQWVAHTVGWREPTSSERDPLRMEVWLTSTQTGEVLQLGEATSTSWGAVWSPDGARVAFYSDEGGEVGIWIWERATRAAHRFPGVVVPSTGSISFGSGPVFEVVRWAADSQRLLAKILPNGTTRADGLGRAMSRTESVSPLTAADSPAVHVRRSPAPQGDEDLRAAVLPGGRKADLAILYLRLQQVTRLVTQTHIQSYAWSPDDRLVAYTVGMGGEANGRQTYDLMVHDVVDGSSRAVASLASDPSAGSSGAWKWSPDGRTIAYIASGLATMGGGGTTLVNVADGTTRDLTKEGVPNFDRGEGDLPPLWDTQSEHLYAIARGQLWRVHAQSGRAMEIAAIPGWHMQLIVAPFGQPTIWTTNGGRTAWVVARELNGARAGIYAIDLTSGQSRVVLQEAKHYFTVVNIDASDASGSVAFVSTDQQHLPDVWMLDVKTGKTRQISRVNKSLDRYTLGEARIIEWLSVDGKPLRGALLLPPGYRRGRRLPLVVFVYGGAVGAATYSVNRFGLVWGGEEPTFNFHLLATRGIAVLYSDAPLRTGRTMTDVLGTVMPGVNAAIEQGYADPERLAVMGQSYGSFNTLSLITQTNRFKAAVITAAVLHPDLVADYLIQSPEYYNENDQGKMGGTIWEYPVRYFDNSPLFRFDRIETPLLIGQGDQDRTLVAADAIFTALERLGKTVEYRLYRGEGHAIVQRPNVIDFWERRFEFLAEHLDLVLDDRNAVVFEGDRAKGRENTSRTRQ